MKYIKTTDLDLPSIYKEGGSLLSRKRVGKLDDITLPLTPHWFKPDSKERDCQTNEVMMLLQKAPIGAVYIIEYQEEWDNDGYVASCRIEKYKKIGVDLWSQFEVIDCE